MTKLRTSRIAGASIIIAFGAALSIAGSASNVDAIRVFGLEDTTDWTASPGATVGTSTTRTQGLTSLSIQTNGYTTMTSRLVGPLGTVASLVSFDLFVPTSQPNPYWMGAAQLFVSIPSLNVNDAYVGQREITGLATGAFHQLNFPLDPDLRNKLNGTYYDATFKVVLNVPPGVTDPYLIDNLQVSSTIPGRSTMSAADIPRILGFESELDWSTNAGTRTLSLSPRTSGNFSLGVVGAGYTVVTSVPMTTINPVDSELSYEVWVPGEQPDPNWWGATQLFVSVPSLGIVNRYLGQHELTGLPAGEFSKVTYTLDTDVQAALNSSSYTDLQFSVVLNLPQGAAEHFLDNFQVGQVTTPPTSTFIPPRGDFVGSSSSGVVELTVAGATEYPNLESALFRVTSEDGNCTPSTTTVCRYTMSAMRLRAGDFSVQGNAFTGAIIRNNNPIRFSIGGAHGFEYRVPSSIQFVMWINQETTGYVAPVYPADLAFSFDPAGPGFMSLSGAFEGSVRGYDVVLDFVTTADAPLVNRMPQADAGQDFTISKNSGTCLLSGQLNGSGSTDPDGNLNTYTWKHNGSVVGLGVSPSATFRRSGFYNVELQARDSFGSYSTDTVVVQVSLPSGCPSL